MVAFKPPHTSIGHYGFKLLGQVVLVALFVLAGCVNPEPEVVNEVYLPEVVAKGRSRTHGLAACGSCHGADGTPESPLTGGRTFSDLYGDVVASNLTRLPDGLGKWSFSEMVWSIRGGVRPDGSELSELHRGYQWLSDTDLFAIISYLRTLAPAGSLHDQRVVSSLDRNTKGFFEKALKVPGSVPAIPKNFVEHYGQYLVDSVARCGSCHTFPAGLFTDSIYLGGGSVVKIPEGEMIAPNITASVDLGIGSWSESDIVKYLRSGERPSGKMVDTRFCPTPFYSSGTEQELLAIAKYLKTVL